MPSLVDAVVVVNVVIVVIVITPLPRRSIMLSGNDDRGSSGRAEMSMPPPPQLPLRTMVMLGPTNPEARRRMHAADKRRKAPIFTKAEAETVECQKKVIQDSTHESSFFRGERGTFETSCPLPYV